MKPLFKSKISLWASILALVVIIGVGATLALMSSSSNAVTNSFTAADIDTEIEETITDGNKEVSIHNYGPSDGYVRARIMVSGVQGGQQYEPFTPENMVQWVTAEKTDEELAAASGKVYIVFDQTILNSDWEQNKWVWSNKIGTTADYYNSWFYYYGVLESGTSTPNLIKKVQLSKDLAEDEAFLENFSVTVYHESVVALDQNLTGDIAEDYLTIVNSFIDTDIPPYLP